MSVWLSTGTRRAVPAVRLAEDQPGRRDDGNDPELDTLLLRLHTEISCRHCGALTLRPADARILDQMAELIVDNKDLVVHLTLGEKIWGFHGDIRVRLSSITFVAPDPKPWMGLRGWRMAGVSFAGHTVLGTRRHGDGYDFCILHRNRPAVQVDLASGRFSRLVICVPEGADPEAEAARIAAAAGIAPSAPAS